MEALLLAILGCGALLGFTFSGLEAGFFALNHLRIRQQMRAGNRRAALLHNYLITPERYLSTIVAGNALCVVAVAVSGVALLDQWLSGPGWVLAGAATGAAWFTLLCRLLPKFLFRAYPNRLSIFFAPLFRLFEFILRPLAWPAQVLTHLVTSSSARHLGGHIYSSRDELRLTMQETPGLTGDERAMIHRVLDLQNLTVQQISVPVAKVTSIEADTPVSAIVELYKERGFSRMPVWGEQSGRRRITGLVDLNSILFDDNAHEERTAADYASQCLRFEASTRLEVALRELQRTNQRLAVVEQDGSEVGIVSLQDILKVIFGEVSL